MCKLLFDWMTFCQQKAYVRDREDKKVRYLRRQHPVGHAFGAVSERSMLPDRGDTGTTDDFEKNILAVVQQR